MYTIKDLSEGKCAVINDGTLEELREVLALAFRDRRIADGTGKYYYDYENGIWDSGNLNIKNLPTQSVKDFLKKYPRVMWVSDLKDFSAALKRVVFVEKNGKFITWDAETIGQAEASCTTTHWGYAKDIEEPKEYTMQEIADALKIDVKDLKIKQ